MLHTALPQASTATRLVPIDLHPGRQRAAALPRREARDADTETGLRLGQVMDLLDYGLVLLTPDGRVQHVNATARRALEAGHPLQVQGDQLLVKSSQDASALREAVTGAALRGLRRLLTLGSGSQRECAAVLPLAPLDDDSGHAVALLLARRQVCEQLTVEWFARTHGLTMAETNVVKGLCADLTPQQIADQLGVGLATVRTQIGSIRLKTGAGSIGALLRQVSLLPPMVSVLQCFGAEARSRKLDA